MGTALRRSVISLVLASSLLGPATATSQSAREPSTSYGYAVFGSLKYPAGFKHFDYVNPDAPKGGSFRVALTGSFDSLNQISLMGTVPQTLLTLSDSLLKQSRDEAASFYCLLCSTMTWPTDLSWTEFELNPRARFDDGTRITPDDVIYSASLGKGLALPAFTRAAQIIERVEQVGPTRVRFVFKMKNNPTLPTVVGLMPIVPKHYWEKRNPFRPTLEIPVAAGPYKLVSADPGHSIIFRRDPNYWAANHPVNKGRFNFDVLRNDFYRDLSLQNEAFRAGLNDLRLDTSASDMRQDARLAAMRSGDIKRIQMRYENGAIYNALNLNARRTFLADRRVRRAVALAYDFEWTNRVILGGVHGRLASNFPNSDFVAEGLPAGDERALLEKYRDVLPPEIFTEAPRPPVAGDRARARANLLEARDLLQEAGYRIENGRLVDPATRLPIVLDLIAYSPLVMNHVALFMRNMAKLGVEVKFRSVDAAQMRHLQRNYDYDILYYRSTFAPLPAPGAGMAQIWTSQAADAPSQLNYSGVKNPAIDEAIGRMIAATDRATVVDMLRAVDRIAQFENYSIPLHHLYPTQVGYLSLAYWDKFGRPAVEQTWNFPYWSADTWWHDPRKQARLSHGVYG
jgi:microcin C transport system substrate-binding protein